MKARVDRPILFNGAMVRAILSGAKTCTRRAVKPQPVISDAWVGGGYWQPRADRVGTIPERHCLRDAPMICPHGLVGMRLWVRETWRQAFAKTSFSNGFVYKADAPRALGMDEYSDRHRWTPSIHMPREASRITLEITDVRVQRLQDMTTEDHIAEGLSTNLREHDAVMDLRDQWVALWESIYGAGSWATNPWVWAITFKRVTP